MVDRREDEEEGGGRSRLRLGLAIGSGLLLLALLAGGVLMLLNSAKDPVRKVQLTIVNIVPPPPPPPPPQQPPPPPEQKQMEDPVKDKPMEEQPKDEKPEEPPPGPLSMDAKGEGPGDAFGLGGKLGGKGFLGGGGGGGGGSRWGWYASIVQSQIEAALKANQKTRHAVLEIQVRLWADASGHVSRVQLVSSTGSPELDATVRDEVLSGLTLRQPPPKDMPMPIIARVTERKAS